MLPYPANNKGIDDLMTWGNKLLEQQAMSAVMAYIAECRSGLNAYMAVRFSSKW